MSQNKIIFFKTMALIMIFLAFSPLSQAVYMTEVMYDPPGADNNKEFIEVYAKETNLSGWIIGDTSSNDTLVLLNTGMGDYSLIVEEGFIIANTNISHYSVGATIGNNLNNKEDSIFLYAPNGSLIDNMSYDGTLANDNGHSLEYVENHWIESILVGGTPGKRNIAQNKTGSNFFVLQNISLNTSSDASSDPTPDAVLLPYGNNTASNGSVQQKSCEPAISILTEKDVFSLGEKIRYLFEINRSDDFVIEYFIEDLSGNIVKKRYNTTRNSQKTWTPSVCGAYVIKAVLYSSCREATAQKLIAVECEAFTEKFEILKVPDGKSGGIIRAEIGIEKGVTAKSAIEVYISDEDGNKISETTKLTLIQKNSRLKVIVPVFIKDSCALETGDYMLTVSGLGTEARKKMHIESKECKEPVICKRCATCEKCKECTVCDKTRKGTSKILSFYTRQKKYSEIVSIFANIGCANCTALLLSGKTPVAYRQFIDQSGTVSFNTSYAKNFSLLLMDTLDSRNLLIGFDKPQLHSQKTPAYLQKNYSKNKITGRIVDPYISKDKKISKNIKYYVWSVLGLGGAITFFRRGS